MVRVSVTSNIEEWTRAFEKRVRNFEKKTSATPKEVADWAKYKAKTIVPKNTGTLMNAIDSKRVGSKKRGEGTAFLYVKKLSNPRWRGKYASAPRYAAIQHSLPRGKAFFNWRSTYNGDPHWLFTVRKEASTRFKKRLLGHLQNFK